MTIIITLAVKPKPGTRTKPYVLMGADSLKILANNDLSGQIRVEDERKIFKVNDKLICMSGSVDTNFYNGFIDFIRENDRNISELADLVLEHIKNHMFTNETYEHARFATYIGCCKDGIPKIAHIQFSKNTPNQHICYIREPQNGNYETIPGGNFDFSTDADILKEFKDKVKDNLELNAVQSVARDLLEKAADRHPETCNKNIKFEILP